MIHHELEYLDGLYVWVRILGLVWGRKSLLPILYCANGVILHLGLIQSNLVEGWL